MSAAGIPVSEQNLSMEELQRRAREHWLAFKAQEPGSQLSLEEQQQRARGRWREYQQSKGAEGGRSEGAERLKPSDRGIDDDLIL